MKTLSKNKNKLKFLSLALGATIALSMQTLPIAFATESKDVNLPTSFEDEYEFTSLQDFTIYGDNIALADSNKIIIYNKSLKEIEKEYTHICPVKSVEYSTSTLYFLDATNTSYSFDTKEEATFNFTTTTSYEVEGDDSLNYYYSGDAWHLLNRTTNEITTLSEYSTIKYFDGEIYAIKQNSLYKLDGLNESKIVFAYTNVEASKNIEVGNMKDKVLENSPAIYNVSENAYMTEVDISSLSETYFKASSIILSSSHMALLLGTSGNASLISIKSKCYLTLTSNLSLATLISGNQEDKEMYTLMNTPILTSPYVNANIAKIEVPARTKVKVIENLSKENYSILSTDFYKVEVDFEGQTYVGYVPQNILSSSSFAEDDKDSNIETQTSNEDTFIRDRFIILGIVALCLFLVGFIVFIHTKSKSSSRREKVEKKLRENKDEEI